MKTEEAQSLFAAQLDVFDHILGQLTEDDLTRPRKEITTILLPLPYYVEKGIHNLTGLVLYEDNYKLRYCAKSPKLTKPAVYDETTPNNSKNVVPAKKPCTWQE